MKTAVLIRQTPRGGQIEGDYCTAIYTAQALIREGHEAIVLDTEDLCLYQDKAGIDMTISVGYAAHFEAVPRMFQNAFNLYWMQSFLGDPGFVENKLLPSWYDGFPTNSVVLHDSFTARGVPSWFVELAVDVSLFHPGPPTPEYVCECAFVGCYPHKTEEQHQAILYPAMAHDFQLWGNGWGNHPDLWRAWRGILPFEDLPKLYQSTKAVLVMTERMQAQYLMRNNRWFEARACGVDILEDWMGKERIMKELTEIASKPKLIDQGAIDDILANHTYDKRAKQFIEIWKECRQ